jgi:hypothetical protein
MKTYSLEETALELYQKSLNIFTTKKVSKRIVACNERNVYEYKGKYYPGVCRVLYTLRLGKDRRRVKVEHYNQLSNEIWNDVNKFGISSMFFPTNEDRINFIKSKITKYSMLLDKK